MLQITASAAREAAFRTIKNSGLEALSNPEVEVRLGAFSHELRDELGDAFLVPREGATAVLPQEQVDEDNIGLHPIVRRDLAMPNVQPFALRLGRHSLDDLFHLDPHSAQRSEIVSRKPFYPFGKSLKTLDEGSAFVMSTPVHAITVPAPAIGKKKIFAATPRPLIGTYKLEKMPPAHIAASLGHTITHIILHEDMVSDLQAKLPHATPENKLAGWQYKTTIERSAYAVGHAILEAHGAQASISVDEAALFIKDLGPEDAGRTLAGRSIPDKILAPTKPLPDYIAAAALTRQFGTPEGWAPEAEALAYHAAGLLH